MFLLSFFKRFHQKNYIMIKLTVKREFSYPHRTIGKKTIASCQIGERAGNFFPFLCKTLSPVI